MDSEHKPVTFSVAALSLALLLSYFLLAACGAEPPSSTQAPPAGTITATPGVTVQETAAPNAGPTFDCASVNEIPAAECQALVALFESTDGPGWTDNGRWLSTATPCGWSGVTCTDGHVTAIHLLYNQLAGTLPPELGNLSRLRSLGLWVNHLSGPVPAELGQLSELVFLDLSGNELTGPLPAELGNLARLETLSLANNQISGPIPSTLGRLENLQSLALSGNRLSGTIPAELGNLANLSSLQLAQNQLSGSIPDALGRLNNLYELDLSYNQLHGSVPESLTRVAQRTLWGNRLEGTVASGGPDPIVVTYEGVHFAADPSLAESIWPERIPARAPAQGDPFWYAAPEHVRFTFAGSQPAPGRSRMGINLAAEAHILLYPLADLAGMDPMAQTQIETLQTMVAERVAAPAAEWPLLPLTNAAQVFHAQAHFLDGEQVQGLRFLTQHSQEARPIVNQDLFYTFQGFTGDGATYVAAFFPVTTAVLPDAPLVEDWETFNANFDAYLTETTTLLDGLSPAAFTPDLTLLDAVVTSLQIEPAAAEADPSLLPPVTPPAGLVYRAPDGLWRVGAGGQPQLLTERANALPAPDAAHAVYMDDEREVWLINLADGSERPVAEGVPFSRLYQWGDARTLLVGVWLAPGESDGNGVGHMATVDVETGRLQVIDEAYVSLGRPALAPDGKSVAYDVSPFHTSVARTGVAHTGYVYHPLRGSQPIDVGPIAPSGGEQLLRLYNPAWSPDGAQLAWLVGAEAMTRLVVFDLGRETATVLLVWSAAQSGALPPAPTWSPDGKWLAVEVWARTAVQSGVWLAPAGDDGPALHVSPLTTSSAAGSRLLWLSAGELLYVACDENVNNCVNVLFDVNAGTKARLDLPAGAVVLQAPPAEPAVEE